LIFLLFEPQISNKVKFERSILTHRGIWTFSRNVIKQIYKYFGWRNRW